jgi:hypothetical protein
MGLLLAVARHCAKESLSFRGFRYLFKSAQFDKNQESTLPAKTEGTAKEWRNKAGRRKAVSVPGGKAWPVLSLENLGIVPGHQVAKDLESPILPATSLLPHARLPYISAHTVREHEPQ